MVEPAKVCKVRPEAAVQEPCQHPDGQPGECVLLDHAEDAWLEPAYEATELALEIERMLEVIPAFHLHRLVVVQSKAPGSKPPSEPTVHAGHVGNAQYQLPPWTNEPNVSRDHGLDVEEMLDEAEGVDEVERADAPSWVQDVFLMD